MERRASPAPALRERNHNFRHFSSFVVVNTLYRFKTVPSNVKCFFEMASNVISHKYVTKVVWYILVPLSSLNNTMSLVSLLRLKGFLLR